MEDEWETWMNDASVFDRRDFLKKVAAAGLLQGCGMLGVIQQALAVNLPDIPQGMISVLGEVSVDGQPSGKGLEIKPGQTVETGKGAEAIYVIGSNAFLQKESSVVHFGTDALKDFMRIASGRILSVFGPGRKSIQVANATIGIRGTACHIGVEPERTYFCLCYGEAEITFPLPNEKPILLKSLHHDEPIYIPSSAKGNIQPARMLDHQDDELKLLEALVGRLPPFAMV
jgi:hypothetical protein